MKIHVEGLASIKDATVDLRPLTVIIGPNNSAKTYLAYVIYGALREAAKSGVGTDDVVSLAEAATYWGGTPDDEDDEDPDEIQLPVDGGLVAKICDNSQTLVARLKDNITEFFQADYGFSLGALSLEADEGDITSLLVGLRKHLPPCFEYDLPFADAGVPLHVYTEWAVSITKTHHKIWPFHPFILPAERTALILTYKILANRRIKLLKEQAAQTARGSGRHHSAVEMARASGEYFLPEPVEDFLNFLAEFDSGELRRRPGPMSPEEDRKEDAQFEEVARLIEKQLNRGHSLKVATNAVGGKSLQIAVPKGPRLPLHNASSSIKQLTPLLLYLRHKARRGDLLVIDEPEANLHPENQVKLLEILAILVSLGVKVLLTTHSPYLMAHLNNLILGDPDPAISRRQKKFLYLKDTRAFLKPEEVSAYELRPQVDGNTELINLHDTEYGTIEYTTLGDLFSDLRARFIDLDTLRHPAKE